MGSQRVRHEWAIFTSVFEKAFKLHLWEIFVTGIDTWDRRLFFYSFRILTIPLVIFSLTWFLMGGSSNFHHCPLVHGGSFLPLLPSTFSYLFQQLCVISLDVVYKFVSCFGFSYPLDSQFWYLLLLLEITAIIFSNICSVLYSAYSLAESPVISM